jgi:hypothetical protein
LQCYIDNLAVGSTAKAWVLSPLLLASRPNVHLAAGSQKSLLPIAPQGAVLPAAP